MKFVIASRYILVLLNIQYYTNTVVVKRAGDDWMRGIDPIFYRKLILIK